jgi:hypothetical protein
VTALLLYVLAVTAVAAALFLPTAAAALLYGCFPALVVLGLGLLLWVLLHLVARRRRTVSSFTRSRHGSSLLRPPPRPAEPSTVDLPDAVGSPSGTAEAARSSSGT